MLGNLTATDEDQRVTLFSHTENGAVLFRLLAEFMQRDEAARSGPTAEDGGRSVSPVVGSIRETSDLLVKVKTASAIKLTLQLMRVIANLCINPDVGETISTCGTRRL